MIDRISDAVIARLKSELPELKTVDEYDGQFEEAAEALLAKLPAAFVTYAGSGFVKNAYRETTDQTRFTLLIGQRNLRGQKAAKASGQSARQLARAALAALRDQKLGLAISPIAPERISLVVTGNGMVVYGFDFTTTFKLV